MISHSFLLISALGHKLCREKNSASILFSSCKLTEIVGILNLGRLSLVFFSQYLINYMDTLTHSR